jgi:class 3 adenylate cyclase
MRSSGDGDRARTPGLRGRAEIPSLDSVKLVLRTAPVARALVVSALVMPLAALVVLLRRDFAGMQWNNPGLHFTFFLVAAGTAAALSLMAWGAARRRGDARVLLLSVGFLATAGFMGIQAAGTQGMLHEGSLPGFTVSIAVGLLVAAPFVLAAAFIDRSPRLCAVVVRTRRWLVAGVGVTLVVWAVWSVANWPPVDVLVGEGFGGDALQAAAAVGAVAYVLSAARLWSLYRSNHPLIVVSVIACLVLLAEALLGVAVAADRVWQPSWWAWHALVLIGYLLVFAAAQREWREDRFHKLYLPTTREHREEVSVLVGDLEGFTRFADARDPVEVAAMLRAYHSATAPLISRRFGGEVEKFAGDGVFAIFNRDGRQPDHALLAVQAAGALQELSAAVRREHPDWPGLRVGVNSGRVVMTEMGGRGYLAFPAVGDPVNVAARLQAAAPVGGVLVGEDTRLRLPEHIPLVPMPHLRLKGKDAPIDAYLVQLPLPDPDLPRRPRHAGTGGGRKGP